MRAGSSPAGELRQRRLPFPRTEVIDMGKPLQQGLPQGGDMDAAEDGDGRRDIRP